jgi:hypothetical protein
VVLVMVVLVMFEWDRVDLFTEDDIDLNLIDHSWLEHDRVSQQIVRHTFPLVHFNEHNVDASRATGNVKMAMVGQRADRVFGYFRFGERHPSVMWMAYIHRRAVQKQTIPGYGVELKFYDMFADDCDR